MIEAERFTDFLDVAAEYQRRLNAEAVANRIVYSGESAASCEECGEVIPEQRRYTIPGVQCCTSCQAQREKRC